MTRPGARRLAPLAYVIGAFGLAMSSQMNFLVPLRARELGAGFDVIGLIVGSGALAAAASSVTSGAAIDRLGPKRAFVVGAFATAGVSAGFMAVQASYWWFLVLQPVYGVVRNLGWVASQSYITSFATDEERPRLTGRFSFFSNVGQMAGPLLVGGAASLMGFRYAFVVPLVYSAVFALVGLLLRETRAADHETTRERQGAGLRSALQLTALRGIQVALLLTFARLWTSHVYNTFFPVFLVDSVGIQPGVVGTVIATSGLVAALMAPTTGFWTRFISQQGATALALTFSAVGLILAPVVVMPWVFVVPVLVGVGQGISLPLLMSIVTTAAPPTQRGVALGLRGLVNQTAATAAPVIVGPLMTALGLGLGFATGGLVAGVMLLAARGLHLAGRRGAGAPLDAKSP